MTGNSINAGNYQPYFPGFGYGGQQPPQQPSFQQPIFPFSSGNMPQQQPINLFNDPRLVNGRFPWPGQPSTQSTQVSTPPEVPSSKQATPNSAGRDAGSTVIVEVGGPTDEHAQSVQDVFETHNPNGQNEVVELTSDSESQSSKTQDIKTQTAADEGEPAPVKDKAELDALIDAGATDAYNAFGKKVDEIVKDGDASVINASLGYSRNDVYVDTLSALQGNPELAKEMGLSPDDIKNLKTDQDGTLLLDEKVGKAVAGYVDGRLDAEGSAYQKAKAEYQTITKNAADHGVTVVVAAGNEHELNSVFDRNKPGGDTNFLAQSDSVISVGATDNNRTKFISDDTIADFSSWGDGEFNPTVATNGVNVKTENGTVDGTSFAAPKVAAIIARLQKENPDLSFEQIKALLQNSAFDSKAPELAEGAGIFNPNAFIQGGLAA